MPEWMVRLAGPEQDLRSLSTYVRDPDWRVIEDGGEFYLRACRPDGLGGAGEAKRAADEIIDWANLTAPFRFERYRGVHIGEVVRVDPDGSRHVTITASGAATIGAVTPIGFATVVGSQPAPPPNSSRDKAVLARRRLRKAMRHLREEPIWYSYWLGQQGDGCGGQWVRVQIAHP